MIKTTIAITNASFMRKCCCALLSPLSTTSAAHQMSATAQERLKRLKVREELEKTLDSNKSVTLQSVIKQSRGKQVEDKKYEMQSIKSSAEIYREQRSRGEIPNSFSNENMKGDTNKSKKTNQNKNNNGSGNEGNNTNKKSWFPLSMAVIALLVGTAYSISSLTSPGESSNDCTQPEKMNREHSEAMRATSVLLIQHGSNDNHSHDGEVISLYAHDVNFHKNNTINSANNSNNNNNNDDKNMNGNDNITDRQQMEMALLKQPLWLQRPRR